jgi:hypothetical protein
MFRLTMSTAAALLVGWVVWKVYHRLRRSPLDNIAGPPADSFLKGKSPILTPKFTFFDILNYVH